MKHIYFTLILAFSLQANSGSKVCVDDGQLSGDDFLTEVSKEPSHKLRRDYEPKDLISVPRQFVLNASGSGERLRKDVLSALTSMLRAAKSENLTLKMYSGYRSFDQQCSTYSSKFRKFQSKFKSELELKNYVDSISATPGRSEHQLGATFDLVYSSIGNKLVYPDIGNRCPDNKCKEYEWLLNNAYKFGFAMSYPRLGSKDFNPITKYNFEPWHWRFVGVDAALEMQTLSKELGRTISIIEYIQFLKKEILFDDLKNPQTRNPAAARTESVQEVVIGAGGDVSLSRPGSDKLDAGGSTFNKFYTWDEMTVNLEKMTAGNDLNFLNLESVVSDKALKAIDGKKFPQKSHPEGVQHLVHKVGFNMISTANNHAYDYSDAGIEETLNHLIKIRNTSKMHMSGIGNLQETLHPEIIEIQGLRIAFLAVGMKGDDRPEWEQKWRPATDKPGMLSVRHCEDNSIEKAMKPCTQYGDLKRALENLKKTPADFRIVSIHEGMELSVFTKNGSKPEDDTQQTKNKQQRQRSENRNVEAKFNLIKSYGVDLILGHHSHNVRPVEFNNQTLSFYGLGNLLFLGGKNYSSDEFPVWNQYGLFAKNYYSVVNGKLKLSAVQVIPLKNNHISPTFWTPEKANQYIDYLNAASQKSFGNASVQFKSLNDGTAVYCVSGIEKGAKAAEMCPSF